MGMSGRVLCVAVMAAGLAACASKPAPAAAPKAPEAVAKPQPKPAAEPKTPAAPKSSSKETQTSSSAFKPDAMLLVCPVMTVSNKPPTEANREITGYKPYIRVHEKVTVAIAPVNGACLTSGFGPRNSGRHKGIDLQVRPASMIHAAAKGVVMEAEFRPDYGWQVVIDHGSGVFTRYAHMVKLEDGVVAGAAAPFGMKLGVMGNTAAYSIPVHLHYEVLVGDYATPKKSFGLTPIDVFGLGFVGG